MNTEELLEKFNAGASQYDRQRRMLIPRFDDFYGTAVELTECLESPRILDIGAGTGLLTDLLLRKHPESRALLIDVSDPMLDRARERFSDNPRISFLQMDYSTQLPEGPFDLVVSALSIHHLSDEDKAILMHRVYNVLSPGGRFINADQVLGPTDFLEKLYYDDWVRRIEATDLSEEDCRHSYERRKLDQSALLDDQLKWLKNVGFSHVDCIYKFYFLAVFLAIKGDE